MIVVSDSGPIIGLAKVDRLELLRTLGDTILVPPSVERELTSKPGADTDRILEVLGRLIIVQSVAEIEPRITFATRLIDNGERDAIALACSLGDDVILLMDDRAGRSAASKLNIPTTGLIGVFLEAKSAGYIDNVGTLLHRLREAGYWLTDEMIEVAKRLASE